MPLKILLTAQYHINISNLCFRALKEAEEERRAKQESLRRKSEELEKLRKELEKSKEQEGQLEVLKKQLEESNKKEEVHFKPFFRIEK